MADGGKTAVNSEEMMADDDAERSVASVEDQLRKEMTVYEVFLCFLCFSNSLHLKSVLEF